jgi:hypothetical protein
MLVKFKIAIAALLLSGAVSMPGLAKDPIPPLHPLATKYLGATLLLHLEGHVTVPMVLNRNGTVSFVDVQLRKDRLEKTYVRTVPFEIRNDKILCVMKESQPCFDFM